MNKCDKCKCKFISKKGFEYHVENKVCTKFKTPYLCMFCNKSYKYKHRLVKHLNNKHSDKIKKNKKNV